MQSKDEARTPEGKDAEVLRRRRQAERFNMALFFGGFTSLSTGLAMLSIELGLIVSGAIALGLSIVWAWRYVR